MASVSAIDASGDPLVTGSLGAIRAEVIDDAGGVGIIRVRLLTPANARRTGAEQTDIINIDANLFNRD